MASSESSSWTKTTTGNYGRYYGYRSSKKRKSTTDPRLEFLEDEWFRNGKVKDVGCNAGQFTLEMARTFEPRYLVGVDADATLVEAAQRAAAQCAKESVEPLRDAVDRSRRDDKTGGVLSYGALPFPHNVFFAVEDYTKEEEEAKDHSFDVICAFSVTKWVHLSTGDDGLLRFFRRAFRELAPGGRFVFEPQEWKSYKKAKAKNSGDAQIKHHFSAIRIRPTDFDRVLVDDVGFAAVHCLGRPNDGLLPKGFRRPIYCAIKNVSPVGGVPPLSSSVGGEAAAASSAAPAGVASSVSASDEKKPDPSHSPGSDV